MSCAEALVAASGARWAALAEHPFVLATADGTLAEAAFDAWLLEDHAFVVAFARVLDEVVGLAPDERARAVLADGLAALVPELALFRATLAARGLDPAEHVPSGACAGYTRWLLDRPGDGYAVALAVLHGVERAYLDAWTAVRERAQGGRYAAFVENWSSPAFGAWVAALAELLGPGDPTAEQVAAQRLLTGWEHDFWDAVHLG